MPYQTIEFNLKDSLACIAFNRPESFNAINEAVFDELLHAIYSCDAPSVRAVYLTGNGKAFSSGGDLRSFGELLQNPDVTLRRLPDRLHQVVIALRHLRKPVVGAINGVAAGAGMSIAMACDIALASDAASFNLAYCRIALSPDGSSTFFLPRLVGPSRALYLMYTGESVSATEAKQLGIVAETQLALAA